MPLTSLTCPICLGTLKPKTAVAEGTRIRCPKCKGSFVAEAEPKPPEPEPLHEAILAEAQEPMPEPAAAEEEPIVAEEMVLEEIVAPPRSRTGRDDDYDRPRRRPARRDDYEEDEPEGRNRYRKRPQKGIPVWVWLVSGGVGLVLLLGCCGVGGVVGWTMIAGSGPVSANNYNQLHKGMSPAQVQNILGPPTTSSAIFNIQVQTWQNGSDFITVQYQNGSAVARSCNIQHNGWVQMQDSGLLPW